MLELWNEVTESHNAREPYKPHTGRFIVNIGNGTDPEKYDYAVIIPDTSNLYAVRKRSSSVIASAIGKKFSIILFSFISIPPYLNTVLYFTKLISSIYYSNEL